MQKRNQLEGRSHDQTGSSEHGDTVKRILNMATKDEERYFIVEWNLRGNGVQPLPSCVSVEKEFRWTEPGMLIDFFMPLLQIDSSESNENESSEILTCRQCRFAEGEEKKLFVPRNSSQVRIIKGKPFESNTIKVEEDNSSSGPSSKVHFVAQIKEEPVQGFWDRASTVKTGESLKPETAKRRGRSKKKSKAEDANKNQTNVGAKRRNNSKNHGKSVFVDTLMDNCAPIFVSSSILLRDSVQYCGIAIVTPVQN